MRLLKRSLKATVKQPRRQKLPKRKNQGHSAMIAVNHGIGTTGRHGIRMKNLRVRHALIGMNGVKEVTEVNGVKEVKEVKGVTEVKEVKEVSAVIGMTKGRMAAVMHPRIGSAENNVHPGKRSPKSLH
jgi:hypothetical protein